MTPKTVIQRGLSISGAFEKYARWPRSQIPSRESWPSPTFTDNSTIIGVHQLASQLYDTLQKETAIARARDENFRKQLSSGRLVASGYRVPRNSSDPPAPIPADVWDTGKIDHSASSIKGAALEFVSVRIMRATAMRTKPSAMPIPAKTAFPKIAARKVGRPSLSREIMIAYEQLKTVPGRIRFNLPMTHTIEQIRRKVKDLSPKPLEGDAMLGDEAIRKVIFKDFRRGQDALRPAKKL